MSAASKSLRVLLNRREWAATTAVAAVVPWLSASARAAPDAQSDAPELPMAVDWPVVQRLDGVTIEPADWTGHVSLLVFWATWCPFCKRQNAHLDKLYRSLQQRSDFRVLAVSVDADASKVRPYLQSNGYAFPVALDPVAGLRARITHRKVIPLSCVIDRQGRLAQMVAGEMFEEDLFDLAHHALAAKI